MSMSSPEKSIVIKVEDLCRTCLAKESELYSIFDVYLDTTTLDQIITVVTEIQITKSDGLPLKICRECKDKAISAYDFKKRSQEADIALHDIIDKKSYIIAIDNTLSNVEAAIGVKAEQLPGDDHEDYLSSECDLPVNSGYTEIDNVKNESSVDDAQSSAISGICETSPEQIDDKLIKVEYEDTFCPLCGTSYENSENLTKHMWDEHAEVMGPKKRGRPKKMVTNTILNKLSENGYYLKTVAAKRMNCAFCKEKCKTKEELITHVLQHIDTKVLCCGICKKMYLNKKFYDSHNCIGDQNHANNLQENDSSTGRSKSKETNFSTEVSLQDLLDLRNNPEDACAWQSCEACGEVLSAASALASHVDAEHPELSLRCALCTKVFATAKSAMRHRSACARVDRSHACTTCGLRFAHEISLNKHILRNHKGQSVSVKFIDAQTKSEQRQFQCETCKRCFYRKDLLVKHTRIHKSSDKFYECDVCKKRFHRSDNLRSHMRVHNMGTTQTGDGGAGTCLCLYCGRSFSNSSNLIVHMRRHTGEKPYKCDFCDKGFPRSSDLQCHRRSHTGEKPCICGICGKGFSRSNKLSRHMRVHTGLKPYKCRYCEKAFSQSNDLNVHVRRHTGDKPYICEMCGDRFIQGTALHNHRRVHGHYPPTAVPSTDVADRSTHQLGCSIATVN